MSPRRLKRCIAAHFAVAVSTSTDGAVEILLRNRKPIRLLPAEFKLLRAAMDPGATAPLRAIPVSVLFMDEIDRSPSLTPER